MNVSQSFFLPPLPLKLRQLRAAVAVCDLGSALRAADLVNLSAPAVLGAISALEEAVGETLFERTPRGMTPTPAGAAFCRRAAMGLNHLKTAESEIRPHRRFADRVGNVHLRTLACLLESSGFSDAARKLGFSQASVHRTARELEELVGCELWQRHGKLIQPTADARRLGYRAALLAAELRMGLDEINEINGLMNGRVAIGALPMARPQWLPQALIPTLTHHPDARVSIIDGPYDEQLEALLRGQIDVILGGLRFPPPSPHIEQEALFDDPLSIVVRAGHPLAEGFDSDHDKLTPSQLDSLNWILPPQTTPARAHFEAFMAAKGLEPPRRVVECNSLVAIRALLLETDHAAILSTRQITQERAAGKLKIMGPPLSGSSQPVGLCFRQGFEPTRLFAGFLDKVRSAAAQIGRPDAPSNPAPGKDF